jgi:hypothetical protein
VSEKNFQALQGINGDNIDCPETNEEDVMPEKGNKRRKLDLVKKITSLRIEVGFMDAIMAIVFSSMA